MFDAKSILEGFIRSASPQAAGTQSGTSSSGAPGSEGGLMDILSELSRSLGADPQAGAGGGASANGPAPDILDQLRSRLGEASASTTGGGSLTDIIGRVLTQATQGVQEGASRVGDATGATDVLGRIAADPNTQDLLAKVKELIAQNQFATGAAAGGLGGLVLGTQTGRSLATGAAKIGAIAMIGGLAYKAYQNYQSGKPLITGATAASAPPAGSGFEPAAVSNDTATRLIQAMIAAAAADGHIDTAERAKILGNLTRAGFGAEAEAFLASEIGNPRSPEALASGVASPEEAAQIYTAARLIAGRSAAETQFLQRLASALRIDPRLAQHIDAAAMSATG